MARRSLPGVPASSGGPTRHQGASVGSVRDCPHLLARKHSPRRTADCTPRHSTSLFRFSTGRVGQFSRHEVYGEMSSASSYASILNIMNLDALPLSSRTRSVTQFAFYALIVGRLMVVMVPFLAIYRRVFTRSPHLVCTLEAISVNRSTWLIWGRRKKATRRV